MHMFNELSVPSTFNIDLQMLKIWAKTLPGESKVRSLFLEGPDRIPVEECISSVRILLHLASADDVGSHYWKHQSF